MSTEMFGSKHDRTRYGFAKPALEALGIDRVINVGHVVEPETEDDMPLMQFDCNGKAFAYGYIFRRPGTFHANHSVTMSYRHMDFANKLVHPSSGLSILLLMQAEADLNAVFVKRLSSTEIARIEAKRRGRLSFTGFSKITVNEKGTSMQTWFEQFLSSNQGIYAPPHIPLNLSLRQDVYRRLCQMAEAEYIETQMVMTPDELVEQALCREIAEQTLAAERAAMTSVAGKIGPAAPDDRPQPPTTAAAVPPAALLPLRMSFEAWCMAPSIAPTIAGFSPERRKQAFVEAFVGAWNSVFDADLLRDHTAEFTCELFDRHDVPVVRGFDDASWTPNRVQRLRTKLGAHPRKPPGGRDAA